jgi:beta-galactosidase
MIGDRAFSQDQFSEPHSSRDCYSFNVDWKFMRSAKPDDDLPGFEAPDFDDSTWQTVSTPHTFNDVDSFRTIISHSGGDRGSYKGLAFYRKHFKLPQSAAGGKVFLEFEGFRQAAQIFLNGKSVGLSENGVNPYGIDISDDVVFGDHENVAAVRVDNRTTYAERSTGTHFEWNTNDFNPDFGGINRHVWLHVAGKIYQTLPVYDGLQTTGVYVYPSNLSVPDRTTDIVVQSQVHNDSSDSASVTLAVLVVDAKNLIRAKFESEPLDMVAGEKSVIEATGPLKDARFWSIDDPYLYDVYTLLSVDGKVVDVNRVTTGFRKTDFKGGAGSGGVYINDAFVYLKGFAQRAADEWAGLGQAYPDWMHDLNARLIRDCHGNYIRWMHVSPQRIDVQSCDRMGIIQVCPAGDKERDAQGRQWEQRLEAMRNSMIYFRNNPSILFWEAGNSGITADHMRQMVALRQQWDPHGGRVMGCRTLQSTSADDNAANTQAAEYFGVMIGQDARTDRLASPTEMFRAYSAERRDRAPLIETEDFRDEGARRFWDDHSPPCFGFKPGPQDTYHWNSETFALAAVNRYWAYWSNRISNPDPAHSKWSGYASIYFSDSNADGRQQSSETCRVSGKVDAVRLPKEIYFAHRVMQNKEPDIHILGHWTYPGETTKTIYVISNTQSVELLLNGERIGLNSAPTDGFIFAFPKIDFKPGALKAVGRNDEKTCCEHELTTTGPPARIKLTPILGSQGLRADAQDVALVDVEVVDASGQRCPTDDDRIDFAVTGPAVWRGGYNSGKTNSTNNLYVNTECGINRVSLRSTLASGKIVVTASRKELDPAEVEIESKPIQVVGGLPVSSH